MSENQQPALGERDSNNLKDSDYFMAAALLSAKRSEDPNTKVGACIVNQKKKIVGTGYNCMPSGCEGMPWKRDDENRLNNKHLYVCHAEMNAIMNKNCADVTDCTMYTTLFPCNECAKLIIQAGLKKVVYFSDKYHSRDEMEASRRMLDAAKILYELFKHSEPQNSDHKITIDLICRDTPESKNHTSESC